MLEEGEHTPCTFLLCSSIALPAAGRTYRASCLWPPQSHCGYRVSAASVQELAGSLIHRLCSCPFLPLLFCFLLFFVSTVFLPYLHFFHNHLQPVPFPEFGMWLPVQWLKGHIRKNLTDMVIIRVLSGEQIKGDNVGRGLLHKTLVNEAWHPMQWSTVSLSSLHYSPISLPWSFSYVL